MGKATQRQDLIVKHHLEQMQQNTVEIEDQNVYNEQADAQTTAGGFRRNLRTGSQLRNGSQMGVGGGGMVRGSGDFNNNALANSNNNQANSVLQKRMKFGLSSHMTTQNLGVSNNNAPGNTAQRE